MSKQFISRLIFSFIAIFHCISCLAFSPIKYERKSVTAIGAVFFKTEPAPEIVLLINNRLKEHLEVPRFDYNELSKDATREFVEKGNKTDLSPSSIQKVLEETIVPQIVQAVNAVAEERAKGNRTEQQLATAAVDKMKGSGLTADDVLKVMNAAYLYLPVVTEWTSDEKNATIKGYVAWYRISQKGNTAKVERVNEATQTQEGNGNGEPDKTYRLKSRSVNGTEFAKIIAVNTWAKNLAVAMKNISAFKLGGEIKNVEGKFVETNLGTKEGLGMDEGYDVLEEEEDDNGKVKTKNVGFIRAFSIGNNTQNENEVSRFQTYIGSGFERGMSIQERPRLGIDITVRPKYFTANIPRYATPIINYTTFYAIFLGQFAGYTPEDYDNETFTNGHGFILKEDATSGIGIDINFNLNIAKLTKVSQLFLNADLAVGVPNAEVDGDAFVKSVATPILYSGYLGPMKKFWFGRMNFNLAGSVGVDVFSLENSDAQSGDFEKMDFIAPGIKLDAGLEYLITPDWTFNIGIGYKAALSPIVAEVKFKDEKTIDISDLLSSNSFFSGFNDVNMSGVNISLGISYALPSLSIDPFAELSARDIDY
jgi:DNA-binding Lrp family transcriptional regulator